MTSLRKAYLFALYPYGDTRAAAHALSICEGGKTWDIGNKWSVRMDRGHAPNMQDHVHVMLRGDDVSIINRDGSPSHKTTRDGVPNWVIDNIKKRGLIESSLIIETATANTGELSKLIERMHDRARAIEVLATIRRV